MQRELCKGGVVKGVCKRGIAKGWALKRVRRRGGYAKRALQTSPGSFPTPAAPCSVVMKERPRCQFGCISAAFGAGLHRCMAKQLDRPQVSQLLRGPVSPTRPTGRYQISSQIPFLLLKISLLLARSAAFVQVSREKDEDWVLNLAPMGAASFEKKTSS